MIRISNSRVDARIGKKQRILVNNTRNRGCVPGAPEPIENPQGLFVLLDLLKSTFASLHIHIAGFGTIPRPSYFSRRQIYEEYALPSCKVFRGAAVLFLAHR
jgi:hypothetical protein